MLELEPGTLLDGRYIVDGVLGRGGMAVVFRAHHDQLGTVHAIKCLLMPTPWIRKRLMVEGRFQARVRHPNIVAVTDVIEVEGVPGLVLEIVEGPALDHLLARGRLDLAQADTLARQILAGVARAHEEGLVHRDLKPGNVLVAVEESGPVAKVTDFGLAKVLGGDAEGGVSTTRSGATMGTPCYMAPEQVRNARDVDERADIWSLGAILYELVTGQRAFPGDDVFSVLARVGDGRYEPPLERVPDLPARMGDAIAGALQVDPARRIGSVAELLEVWTEGGRAALGPVSWSPALLAFTTPAPAPRAESGATFLSGESRASLGLASVSSLPTPPPVASPAPVRSRGRAVAGVGVVAIGLVAVGWWVRPGPASVPAPLVPAASVEVAPAPIEPAAVVPVPAAVRVPAEVSAPTPRRAAAPAAPTPAPVAPEPTVAPAPPASAEVRVSGDRPTTLWAEADGARHPLPGTLAPGAYTLGWQFADGEPGKLVGVLVGPGGIDLACSAFFRRCQLP